VGKGREANHAGARWSDGEFAQGQVLQCKKLDGEGTQKQGYCSVAAHAGKIGK